MTRSYISIFSDCSRRGAALQATARETRQLRRFLLAVPTGWILHDYDKVRDRGSSVEIPDRSEQNLTRLACRPPKDQRLVRPESSRLRSTEDLVGDVGVTVVVIRVGRIWNSPHSRWCRFHKFQLGFPLSGQPARSCVQPHLPNRCCSLASRAEEPRGSHPFFRATVVPAGHPSETRPNPDQVRSAPSGPIRSSANSWRALRWDMRTWT